MIHLTIDGIPVQVEPGTSVLEAAKKNKIDVPHYCYHQGLTIAGNCRICLVEIEKIPKLQISCATIATEGMVVSTQSPKVKEARQGVMEFILVNHPIDCPICDCAGECRLQDYYMQHNLKDSRVELAQKIHKKKVVDIGTHVMLDSERCILCSRCVRFCEEVPKTGELGIFNRGSWSELSLQDEVRLENDYSGNVVDICPVGALTDKDFRFRSRVWFLNETPSVCPGCSRGCNIYLQHNESKINKVGEERVYRIKPRFNQEVNKWWICDEGRYGYSMIDKNRVTQATVLENNSRTPITREQTIERLVVLCSSIKANAGQERVGVISSPHLTNEDLFVIKKLFQEGLGISKIHYGDALLQTGKADSLLMQADKSPNRAGARAVADGTSLGAQQILEEAELGKLETLIIINSQLDLYFDRSFLEKAFSRVPQKIALMSHHSELYERTCTLIVPTAVYAEKDGTFTNFEGRVQRLYPALPPWGQSLPETQWCALLAEALGLRWSFKSSAEIFEAASHTIKLFSGITYSQLGSLEKPLSPEVVHKGAV